MQNVLPRYHWSIIIINLLSFLFISCSSDRFFSLGPPPSGTSIGTPQDGLIPAKDESIPTKNVPTPPDGHGNNHDANTPGSLKLSTNSVNFGIQSVGSRNFVTVTVTNDGDLPVSNITVDPIDVPFGFKGNTYPGLGGTCGSSLAGHSSCSVVISFIPEGVEESLGTFNTKYTSGGQPKTVTASLKGEGTDVANLRFSLDGVDPANELLNIGSIPISTVVTRTIYVLYAGKTAATGVSFSGLKRPMEIVSTTCGDVVKAMCSLVVQFTAEQPGSWSGRLDATYNNSAYAARASLIVTAITVLPPAPPKPPNLTITAINDGNFGTVLNGRTYEKTFSVYNSGDISAAQVTPKEFLSPIFSFKGAYPGIGGTCGDSIGPAATCTIVVAFNPPRTAASHSDQLALNYKDSSGNIKTAQIVISGTGKNPAILTVTPNTTPETPYNFGSNSVNYVTSKSFTISNPSTSIDGTALNMTGLTAPFASTNNCGAVLRSGGTCTVTASFKPAAAGVFSGNSKLNYFNGESVQSAEFHVSGTGSEKALLVVSTWDFGSVIVGNSLIRKFNVNYYGLLPALNVDLTGVFAPFSFSGAAQYPGASSTCGNTISGNCYVSMVYTPLQAKSDSQNLILRYQNGVDQNIVNNSFTIKGSGVTPAFLRFVEAPKYYFAEQPFNSSTYATLTVENTGAAKATITGIPLLPAPFSYKGGSFPGAGGTCQSSISTGRCTVVVSFAPFQGAVEMAPLSLNYNDGVASQTASIILNGIGYSLATISTSGVNFNKVAVNQSTVKILTVSNTGTANATNLSLSIAAPFSIDSTTCSLSLAPGGTCEYKVRFAPTIPGSMTRSADLNFNDGRTLNKATANLSGTGTVPVQVAANGDHTCTITDTAQVKCWGHNNFGQLGQGDRVDRGGDPTQININAVDLGTNRFAKKIAVGYWHTCALLDDSSLKCWGSNFTGQLGIGNNDDSKIAIGDEPHEMGNDLVAVNLGTNKTAVDLSLGYAHSCALLNDSSIKCWGLNAQGQLGMGDTTSRGASSMDIGDNLPAVDLKLPATTVVAGTADTCAILQGGYLKCWGDNFYGQLGLGDWRSRGIHPNEMGDNLPVVNLGTARTVKAVSAGGGAFHCAILDNGDTKCWGRQDKGNLGVPMLCQNQDAKAGPCSDAFQFPLRGYGLAEDQMGDNLPAINLGSNRKAVAIASGINSSCAILDNNDLKCWGRNNYGQLGQGDLTSRGSGQNEMGDFLPVTKVGGSGVIATQITGGSYHVCVVTNDAKAKCWADNRFGQLATGDLNPRGVQPNQMGENLGNLPF